MVSMRTEMRNRDDNQPTLAAAYLLQDRNQVHDGNGGRPLFGHPATEVVGFDTPRASSVGLEGISMYGGGEVRVCAGSR
ncbi:hypothetical protein RRF57_004136 [Xylaria bambusicola]|uniref:Uncharacterized protein n=1 Tax=Xylaria bambusicola TaxID=326684 RepID=A0AAN7UN89_9PEZI